MKVYGLFRGFPGLGRVVSGLEMLDYYKKNGCETKVFTYYQGIEIAKNYNYDICYEVKDKNDISSMGIIPVSISGVKVIEEIQNWEPDLIICDGEPLMIETLSLLGYKNRTIAIVNPYDMINPNINESSQLYYRYLFGKAGMVIVHGLWNVENKYKNEETQYISIPTILRSNVLDLKVKNGKKIVGILGGGAANCSENFITSTINIGKKIMQLASNYREYDFEIYCNDKNIAEEFRKLNRCNNVDVIDEYKAPEEIYKDAQFVISRAGRNTISELIYLGIPSIVVATAGNFRTQEQMGNINAAIEISEGNIQGFSLEDTDEQFCLLFEKIKDNKIQSYGWQPGSFTAFNEISKFIRGI